MLVGATAIGHRDIRSTPSARDAGHEIHARSSTHPGRGLHRATALVQDLRPLMAILVRPLLARRRCRAAAFGGLLFVVTAFVLSSALPIALVRAYLGSHGTRSAPSLRPSLLTVTLPDGSVRAGSQATFQQYVSPS